MDGLLDNVFFRCEGLCRCSPSSRVLANVAAGGAGRREGHPPLPLDHLAGSAARARPAATRASPLPLALAARRLQDLKVPSRNSRRSLQTHSALLAERSAILFSARRERLLERGPPFQ